MSTTESDYLRYQQSNEALQCNLDTLTTETRTQAFQPPTATTGPELDLMFALLQQMQLQRQEDQARHAEDIRQHRADMAALLEVKSIPTIVTAPPPAPKLPPLYAGPNAEAEIKRFEQQMAAFAVPRDRWAAELQALLRDDLTNVSSSIPDDKIADFDFLKSTLLARLGITQATRFASWFDPKPKQSETMAQLFYRCLDNIRASIKHCTTVDEVAILLNTELMYTQMAPKIATSIRGMQLLTPEAFVRAVDNHVAQSGLDRRTLWQQPRAKQLYQPWQSRTPTLSQHLSKQMFLSDARQEISTQPSVQPAVESESHSRDQPKSPHKLSRYFHDSKGPLCFNCQQWGHIANTCPNPKVPKPVRQILRVHDFSDNDGEQTLPTLYAMGKVNNHPVWFFLDSGAEISVINAALLHQLEEFGMDKATLLKDRPIADVHGHTVSMPIVSIPCSLLDTDVAVPMAISNTLPQVILLGKNCPLLYQLIQAAIVECPDSVAHTNKPVRVSMIETRQQTHEDTTQQQDQLADMLDSGFPSEGLVDLLNGDIETKEQEENEELVRLKEQEDAIALSQEQAEDETLHKLWQETSEDTSEYVVIDKVLHRQTMDQLGAPRFQIVVPSCRRLQVLRLAHTSPMAGHVGSARTKFKILKSFFGPGIGRDVTSYCAACERCQKTAKTTHSHAPLVKTQVNINRPFEKVAIDIVGPLPLTKNKNRYILTYVDLGSRYPDAVPLKTTTAKVIAQELVNIMARFSVPLEILSDRGSNFLSATMKETFKFLGIQHSKTAPYRPQSNGAVERFHHSLMQMLRKMLENNRDWDELLPTLLFACREVPCQTTGFSSFQLIFGQHVHGPLDILARQWMPRSTASLESTEWICQLREDLADMRTLATDSQEHKKAVTKTWFDRTATVRTFTQGDQVLVFTPTITGKKTDKLTDRWSGPYSILGRLSPVTYEVDMPEKHKKQRTVHVTALKLWHPPIANVAYLSADVEDSPELPDYHSQPPVTEADIGPSLETSQHTEALQIWHEYQDVITHHLGTSASTTHPIDTKDAVPVHLHPYRIARVWQELCRDELKLLQNTGLIEPSHSPWGAPMFPVPKKTPGSIRLVVDYRRLNTLTVPDPYFIPRIEETL